MLTAGEQACDGGVLPPTAIKMAVKKDGGQAGQGVRKRGFQMNHFFGGVAQSVRASES